MRNVIYILTVLLLYSCHPRKFSILRDFDPSNKKKVELDDNYQFYVREVYKTDSANTTFSLTDRQTPAPDGKKTLVEIEYVLYSKEKGKVVYITTVPDRYQTYYSTHRMPEGVMNARDFNTFHLGKVNDDGGVDFRTLKGNIVFTWECDITNKTFSIERIIETKRNVYQNERTVKRSIFNGAVFRKINHFDFVYQDNKKDTSRLPISDHTLYFIQKKKRYCAIVRIDNAVPKRFRTQHFKNVSFQNPADSLFRAIIFKGPNRIPYDPRPILE